MEKKKSQRSLDAEQRFREQLNNIQAIPNYKEWLGCLKNHEVICSCGRKWIVRPDAINKGTSKCRACYNDRRLQNASNNFNSLLKEGGFSLKEEYSGPKKLYKATCAAGHNLVINPRSLARSENPCLQCSARESYNKFSKSVVLMDGILVERNWLGYFSGHEAICLYGHKCYPIPASLQLGHGICSICSGNNFDEAGRKFKEWLAKDGAKLIEPNYLGARKLHRITCKNGHFTTTRPNYIQQGGRPCRFCAGRDWDAFYVVFNIAERAIKFGITSGNARPRLLVHARNGFSEQVRLFSNLPETIAPDMERLCISTLRDAGWTPVQGREYFDIGALPTVLDIVDNYPVTE